MATLPSGLTGLTGPTWRVAAFAVGLVAVLGAGFGVGRAVGPIETEEPHADGGHADVVHVSPASAYELVLERPRRAPGRSEVAFTVTGHDGEPVTSYDVQHGKELHLILVRSDLGGYRHVHPALDEETGRWRVPVHLEAGAWRAYADFAPAGKEPALAEADLTVGGAVPERPLGPDTTSDTVDGYQVHLTREGSAVTLHVTRDGRPVTDLQPYLGAYGHLVAIRAADLDYLHVHPEDGPPGPEIGFHAEFTEAGRYRLFLDFKHRGVVRTAVFTITAGGSDAAHSDDHAEEGDDGHGH